MRTNRELVPAANSRCARRTLPPESCPPGNAEFQRGKRAPALDTGSSPV
ncbi:hypothetical protein [Microbulbifer halophilus]